MNLSETAVIRLSKQELASLDARADSLGMTRSTYMRQALFSEPHGTTQDEPPANEEGHTKTARAPLAHTVRFNLSKDGLAALDARARALGLRRSDYLRLASTLDVSTSAGGAVVLDASAFFRMFCELNRWGVNFNQGVRALNTIASRLRKDSLTAEEKAFVASRAKAAASCLEGAEAGLADVHAALCELAGRSHVTIAPRTALRLREGLRCRS